jgi:NAD(P)-dependent dehydrogenase (short-subunit alcohol dehydrogenase family)
MLRDQVALITGASRGLGKETARLLARRGLRLILTARGENALEQSVGELQTATPVVALPGDVADPSHARRLVTVGLQSFGQIDFLINNASVLGPTPMPRLEALPLEGLENAIRVNVVAPLSLVQLVLPQMKARGTGTIVNVTSDAGVQAYAGWGAYGTSKAALEQLSRVLAQELKGTGIRVYVVDPGEMNTQMYREAEPGADVSHMPGADAAAAALVDLVARQTAPSGRFELRRWAAQDQASAPQPAGIR